jgi:serine/threonine protein kinase/Flp pilus assembly protein TadD
MSPKNTPAVAGEGARSRKSRRQQRYQLLDQIGAGGMGTVYRALDRELNRTVAVKVIRPEFASDLSSLLRLKREIVLASRVSGNRVVRVHDIGEVNGQALIAMDWVDGENLAALLARVHTVPPSQVCDFAGQIGAALRDIHAANIIHRDLKPGNLLITRKCEILVADFGLARSALPQDGSLSLVGESAGTPRYMAPEQLAGLPADIRSDLFSLGMVLLEMLTGATALEGLAPLRERWVLAPGEKHVRSGELRKLAALDLVIRRCLQLDRTERYAHVDEVLRDLKLADAESAPAAAPVSLPRRNLWFRSRITSGAAAAILLLGGALLWSLRLERQPPAAQLYGKAISLITPTSGEPELRLAAQALEAALAQTPRYQPALRARLDVLLRLYEATANPRTLVDAREALQSARAAGLDKSQSTLYLAKIDLDANLYLAVIRNLESDPALLASSADANRLLGRALETAGRLPDALASYRAAVTLAPESWHCHNDLAAVLLAIGHPEEARQHFLQVTRLNPDSATGYSNLGLALLESGELDAAQQNFEIALQRHAEPETYYNLGLTTYYSGRYASALPFFQSAIQMRPQSDRYVAALAEAQWHAGERALARQTYARVMALLDQSERTGPLGTIERCRRALCFSRLGDFDAARSVWESARSSSPQDPMVDYTGALLAVAEGRRAAAKAQLANAIRNGYPPGLAKTDPDLRF